MEGLNSKIKNFEETKFKLLKLKPKSNRSHYLRDQKYNLPYKFEISSYSIKFLSPRFKECTNINHHYLHVWQENLVKYKLFFI